MKGAGTLELKESRSYQGRDRYVLETGSIEIPAHEEDKYLSGFKVHEVLVKILVDNNLMMVEG